MIHLIPSAVSPLFRYAAAALTAACLGASGQEEAGAPVPGVRIRPRETPKTFAVDSQFTVYGPVGSIRSRAFRIGEEVKKEVLHALQLRTDKWKVPIVIQSFDRVAVGTRSIRGAVRLLPDGSVSLQIDLATGAGLDEPLLHDELVRWVLVEMMIRRVNPDSLEKVASLELPDWLHHGVLELIDYRRRGRPSDLFASVFRLGKTLTIQEILNADVSDMDSVSMGIYRISSCALLLLLLDQPSGPDRLVRFISEIPTIQGDISVLLLGHYPMLRGQTNSMEKWWSLQLAASAQPAQDELFTMQETDVQLGQALQVVLPPEPAPAAKPGVAQKLKNLIKGKPKPPQPQNGSEAPSAVAAAPQAVVASFEELGTFSNRSDLAKLLQRNQSALVQLQLRAHPFYRGIIDDYLAAISLLAEGKERGLAEQFAALAARRTRMVRDSRAVEDYLDWYEATQRTEKSGAFRGYLETTRKLERPARAKSDPISRYLDAMEREYR